MSKATTKEWRVPTAEPGRVPPPDPDLLDYVLEEFGEEEAAAYMEGRLALAGDELAPADLDA